MALGKKHLEHALKTELTMEEKDGLRRHGLLLPTAATS
jgi:hypothetical protein